MVLVTKSCSVSPTSNGTAEHSRKLLRCGDCRGVTMMSTCDFASGSNLSGIGVHRLSTAETRRILGLRDGDCGIS